MKECVCFRGEKYFEKYFVDIPAYLMIDKFLYFVDLTKKVFGKMRLSKTQLIYNISVYFLCCPKLF